jgi:UDP-GlcNAc:undecaprenyl-phosphate GlcNAc-1-phosphate transferase
MVGGVALLWISLLLNVNQPAVAILALIFIGAVLGFWWFNFPVAKIELGTSGSYFIGFFLAATAVISGTKIATAMIVLALPVVDFFWVIFERIFNRRPPAPRDLNHLHHKLMSLGWSPWVIVLSYMIFISAMLFLSFYSNTRFEKVLVVFFEICVIVSFLYIISRKLLKKQKK